MDEDVHKDDNKSIPFSVLRKVRSVDFGALRSQGVNASTCMGASKFSHAAQHDEFSCKRRTNSFRLSDKEKETVFDQGGEGRNIFMRVASGRSPWTVLSVLVLVFVTFTNFALEIVNAQMHQLDSPYYYDALSPEVISPPFSYKRPGAPRPTVRLGLGSAAISSVTEALSPILPFTGGVDLRREEVWQNKGSWYDTASSVVSQLKDAFGIQSSSDSDVVLDIPRAGGQASNKMRVPNKVKTNHVTAISDSKPFLPINDISLLTLSDLTTFIQYATGNHRPGFDRNRFLNKVNDRVKPLLAKMDAAVQTSRGKGVLPARTTDDDAAKDSGDVDALQFCAAMRVFAEWRLKRQVPEEGYKGYAVGMNLGYKDIVQNLQKMEHAVHAWIDYRREVLQLQEEWDDDSSEKVLRSPTLRQLLEHEVDMQVHSKLPRLKEKSAAMGLLWVRRQLHYQTSIFANILKVPKEYPNSNAAVSEAYREVYGQYHGWAVQKIFNYSFQAAPEVEEIYKFMNPHRLEQVKEAARRMASSSKQATTEHINEDKRPRRGKKDMNPIEKVGHFIGHEWDKFARHIGGEWDKLVDNVVKVFDQDHKSCSTRIRGGAQPQEEADMDHFITKEMAEDAHQHIRVYLSSAQPLLTDLAGLFDDLNMDDPTKV